MSWPFGMGCHGPDGHSPCCCAQSRGTECQLPFFIDLSSFISSRTGRKVKKSAIHFYIRNGKIEDVSGEFLFFWPHLATRGILVPQPEIKPVPSELEAKS